MRPGRRACYINGVQQAADSRPGKLEWNNKYQLALANEPTNDRPWLGEYYMVAIYSQALSAGEVQSNFAAALAAGGLWLAHHRLAARQRAGRSQWRRAGAVQRHAAATLLPARLALDVRRRDGDQPASETRANPLPLSFAVSPYVGLAFRRAPEVGNQTCCCWPLSCLCLDQTSGGHAPGRVVHLGSRCGHECQGRARLLSDLGRRHPAPARA